MCGAVCARRSARRIALQRPSLAPCSRRTACGMAFLLESVEGKKKLKSSGCCVLRKTLSPLSALSILVRSCVCVQVVILVRTRVDHWCSFQHLASKPGCNH
jgi:hypothetical protein